MRAVTNRCQEQFVIEENDLPIVTYGRNIVVSCDDLTISICTEGAVSRQRLYLRNVQRFILLLIVGAPVIRFLGKSPAMYATVLSDAFAQRRRRGSADTAIIESRTSVFSNIECAIMRVTPKWKSPLRICLRAFLPIGVNAFILHFISVR